VKREIGNSVFRRTLAVAALLLAAALCLSGCSGGKNAAASSAPAAEPTPAASAQKPDATPEPTAEPEPAPTPQKETAAADLSSDGQRAAEEAASDKALLHAWETWEDWDKVDAAVLDKWLDGRGMDRSTDPNYPNLTMEVLQGTWYNKEDDITLTISGDLCTLTCPKFGYDSYTVPCILINRSAEHNCPELMAMVYPQFPVDAEQGFAWYINKMTRPDHFDTTDWGSYDKQK
jgi:hypothetical protein